MTGGLIQIVSYGSEDLFLTGSPQITFFKILYRRYSNFAIESIKQDFNNLNFDEELNVNVEKIGDLMSKIYLEIDIPKVDFKKDNSQSLEEYNKIKEYFNTVSKYLSDNIDIIKKLYPLLQVQNISMDEIRNSVGNNHFDQLKKYIEENYIGLNPFHLIQELNTFDINKLLYQNKENLFHIISNLYPLIKNFYMKIYNLYHNKKQSFNETQRYKFAWFEKLGHAIIEYFDIKIGNQIIDKQTGDWLTLYSYLFIEPSHIPNYNKMIGNIDELTVYDDKIKNSYKLIIPLQFWFCRNLGLALPLIALRYHDIIIDIKLKKLKEVSYFEKDHDLQILNATLYIDYIYLDVDERKRFAQNTHEYLIETTQFLSFSFFNNEIMAKIDFINPIKFITWFIEPDHTIINQYLSINNQNITDPNFNHLYFNYYQPYLYFKNIPPQGINVYSFSLNPTEHQPSGTLNLSIIKDFSLTIELKEEKNYILKIYAMNYNILRIAGGMAGLAF